MKDGSVGTRESLMMHAAALLEGQGKDALTLRALGASTGLSRGAAYRHFAGKDELLAALASRAMQDLNRAMAEAWATGRTTSFPARLERMLWAYAERAISRPEHYRLIFSSDLDPSRHPDLEQAGAEAFATLVKAIGEGTTAGEIAPANSPQAMAALLFSSVHGLVDLLLSGHGRPEKGLSDPRGVVRLLVALVAARAHPEDDRAQTP